MTMGGSWYLRALRLENDCWPLVKYMQYLVIYLILVLLSSVLRYVVNRNRNFSL